MLGWESSLDRWLTTPPEYPYPPVVDQCGVCRTELCAGEKVFEVDGETRICAPICLDYWLQKHIEEYLELLPVNTKRVNRFKKYVINHWGQFLPLVMNDVGEVELEYEAPEWDEAI